jgi:hypothetical protein
VRLRRLLPFSLCLVNCFALLAQPKPKQAKVTCASCHQTEAFSQPQSQMAHAMEVPGSNAVLNGHPKLTFRTGPYSYSVETHGGKSEYIVSDGTQSVTVPILWALGANAQTWVLERNGQLYESRVSYYPLINGLGITTGDEKLDPRTVEEAIGRPISNEETKLCFGCHTTGAVVDHKLNLAALKPGLTCEHCHVDAPAHLAAILADAEHVPIPKKLGEMSSEDTSNFCGQCHRTWETVVRSHWRGQADVRFQPYRLANSKCFNGTDARISCVACHNPHEKIVRDSASYDPKCLACHSLEAKPAVANGVHAKVCPVAKSNCSSCHMPKVPLPNGLMELTDHQIRVVKPNEPYPN